MASKPVIALGAVTAAVVGGELTGFTLPTGLIDAGPWGLLVAVVAFIFYGVFRGWIIPKPHYDTLMARALAAETANIKLAETNAVLVNTNDVQARTIEKQTAVGDTVEKVMGAIQDARASAGGTR
jgi:hypothetical protein